MTAARLAPIPHSNLGARSGLGVRQPDGAANRAASSGTTITFLTVPAPPSVNKMFKNLPGRGRGKTKAYKDWAGEAGWTLKSQHPLPVHGPVLIMLAVERSNLAADIDNRVKAIFDLLVAHEVIDDDKMVTGFCTAWAPQGSDVARIAIMPAADITCSFSLAEDGRHGGWFLNAPEEGAA